MTSEPGGPVGSPIDDASVAGLVALVADSTGYGRFEEAARSCRFCAEPIRLSGEVVRIATQTGEVLETLDTTELPWGVLLKPCGTRRASRCPACARIYQGDARQLVRAGLVGGKGVPEEVASRPLLFATLTAPSFGPVHRVTRQGARCHPVVLSPCQHERPQHCLTVHQRTDPLVGEALCVNCYDFAGAVLFNATLSDLWRRTAIYTRRHLARVVGLDPKTLRLAYAKVAEFQERGVVHLHIVVRLDVTEKGAAEVSTSTIATALRLAIGGVRVPYRGGFGEARWGSQFDWRPLERSDVSDLLKVANYVAKYATKGSDDNGTLDRRLHSLADLDERPLRPQLRRMVETAWHLGEDPALASLGLRRWAHTLGLRSHFLTKSRQFSTTFGALRQARLDHHRAGVRHQPGSEGDGHETLDLSEWTFTGRGWKTDTQRYLVRKEALRQIEARRLAFEDGALTRERPS